MQQRTGRFLWPTVVVLLVAAVGVGAAFGVRALWNAANGHFTSTGCTVGSYGITTSQAAVASTMAAAVTQHGLPERAAVLVLAAGLQESKLTNLPPDAGDRDSVGVLQQRPSQGWGTAAQLNDVQFATGAFLDQLVKHDGWESMPLADAVQAVQISADGTAYARHEPEAQALADALLGVRAAGISCSFDAPTVVAPASTVARQVADQLPVHTPAASGSTVRVAGARWQTAAWFVANADRLGIDRVDFSGQEWTRAHGWKAATTAVSTAVVATMYVQKP